jgi:molybdate transport system substrate-binding protein
MKSLKSLVFCLFSLLLTLWLGSCTISPPSQIVSLNFVATGMIRTALDEIETLYQQEHPNIWLNQTFAGSGAIQTAVEQGEPFDGVLFANIPPLDVLQAKGLILPKSRREQLTTDIVVIAPANSAVQLTDLRELASNRIKTVAMGNQDLAIGQSSQTMLSRLGIVQAVTSKAVWAKGHWFRSLGSLQAIARGG